MNSGPEKPKSTGTQTSEIVLNNKLLTHLISETYTKFVDLEEKVTSHQQYFEGSCELFQLQETQLSRNQELQDLTEEVLREHIRVLRKDVAVIRARLSLIEGRLTGSISCLEPQEPPPPPTNPFTNPESSSSKSESNPFSKV